MNRDEKSHLTGNAKSRRSFLQTTGILTAGAITGGLNLGSLVQHSAAHQPRSEHQHGLPSWQLG